VGASSFMTSALLGIAKASITLANPTHARLTIVIELISRP
jgi:hypothetical protein